jgi:hypothetical protein
MVNPQGSLQEIDGSYFMYSSNHLTNGEGDGKDKRCWLHFYEEGAWVD